MDKPKRKLASEPEPRTNKSCTSTEDHGAEHANKMHKPTRDERSDGSEIVECEDDAWSYEEDALAEEVNGRELKAINKLLRDARTYDLLEAVAMVNAPSLEDGQWLRVTIPAMLGDAQVRYESWMKDRGSRAGFIFNARPAAGVLLSYLRDICPKDEPEAQCGEQATLQIDEDVVNIETSASCHLMYDILVLCAILRDVCKCLIANLPHTEDHSIMMSTAADRADDVLSGVVLGDQELVARLLEIKLPKLP